VRRKRKDPALRPIGFSTVEKPFVMADAGRFEKLDEFFAESETRRKGEI
jgi:hypothetical protein